MKSLGDIERDVRRLADRIEAPPDALPTFGRTQDGARPHVEVTASGYHYVIVERGCELERHTTSDEQALMYTVFVDVTHQMAFRHELHHRVEGQDCRRIAFRKQLELMQALEPAWAARLSTSIERTLAKFPYQDEAPSGGSSTASRTASCSCGQLRIRVEGEPRVVGLCHCLACQQRTGSVFAALASFAAPFEVFGRATEYVRTGDQGARFVFRFCPVCGTTVFHTEEGEQGSVGVAVGAFADPGFPAPRFSIYDSRRHPWVQLPPGTTAFDKDPT